MSFHESEETLTSSKLQPHEPTSPVKVVPSHNEILSKTDEHPLNMQFKEIIIVLLISSGQFISLLGAVQGIPQMASIASTFSLRPDQNLELGWCNAAYATTATTFVIIAGKLGDINGHKNMFIFGYAWLTLWSLLTGFSKYAKANAVFFYFCRGAQGIGSAFLTPTGLALLGKHYPPCKRKNYVFSFYGACGPFGIVAGSVFSALFTQLTTWAWTYWSMAVTCLIITILSYIFIPKDNTPKRERSAFYSFDYVGGFCGITGMILFSVVWNQAPLSHFKAPYVYSLLIVSVVFMTMALIIDSRVKDPLIPWKSMCSNVIKALIVVFFGFLGFTIWLFYSWRFYLVAKNDSLLLAAAKFIPLGISGIFAACFSVLLLNKKVPVQLRLLTAVCAFLICAILISTMTLQETYWGNAFVATVIIAIGLDVAFPSATLLLSNGVLNEQQGLAAALAATALNYGTALGPGVATLIITYQCDDCLARSDGRFVHAVHIAGYVAIGTAGIAVVVAIFGSITEYYKERMDDLREKKRPISSEQTV
ncbi:hypothetical protein KAFR_0C04860 [Kazachstania africana CBS 2517]|uniref:Major facilitator superfamily (MFS) profile domain-containing protein n=1 Tax=Kazachstania africana (strain ATCC 22294 / BCRC 22015 / CBS 2517 / CECT 1963 / NBRC 1671 / NRRL Y-8276) TaxID=1071382 RepID=H2ASX7_KAZAF|nr:hypothetical protein KAFR_0C04860 [Kazachstania africana CBS 2517]CCF57477.1 hypothetical protein KAFR_0C04860 [Kazachstania africana CBS 2517]